MRKIHDIKALLWMSALGVISATALAAQPTQAATLKPSDSESIIPSDKVTINYEKCTLQVETTDDEVMVAFPTVKVIDDEIVDLKIKSWDTYTDEYKPEDSNVITIDLSSLKFSRDSYVAVKSSATEKAYLIHFRPSTSSLKAQYVPEDRTVSVINRADDNNDYDGYFEFRTANSAYTMYDTDDESILKPYEMEGATLYFRELAGYVDGDILYSSGSLASYYTADRIGALDIAPEYVLYDAVGQFSGKELKVKIPKLGNAPTASINYNKRTLTVRKGCEYRLDTQDSFKMASNANITVKVGNDAGVLEVRTAEKSQRGKYTPASKISRYVYPATNVPVLTDDDESPVGKGTETLSLRYDANKKKYNFISTDLNNTYLIYAVPSGSAVPVAGDKTILKIKPTKDKSIPTAVSATTSKLPAGYSVYVSYASTTKDGQRQWASEPILLGTVK